MNCVYSVTTEDLDDGKIHRFEGAGVTKSDEGAIVFAFDDPHEVTQLEIGSVEEAEVPVEISNSDGQSLRQVSK